MDEELRRRLEALTRSNENLNNNFTRFFTNGRGAGGGNGIGPVGGNNNDGEGNIFTRLLNRAQEPLKGFTDQINRTFQMGISQSADYYTDRVADVANGLDFLSSLISRNPLSGLGDIVQQIGFQIEDELRLRTKINEETGLTGRLSEDLRQSIVNSIPGTLQMGYGIERMAEFYTKLVDQSGKFTMLNQEVLVRTAQVTRAFTGDISKTAEFIGSYEKIGFGASDALESINKIGVKSLELGLKSKKTVEDVAVNIGKLNEYGFKNGVQGLTEMARKSTEFRMNMSETFKIADKVFSPEGAIELSANLSIIGGQLGAFNDPLKLMYMATNNVEGLQDALIGAAKGLATYNTEQGRFEITGINLRKAKAMAQELGIEYSEFAKGAIAAAERTQAATALMSTGLKMNDEDREFITNLSQMEKGEMVIKVPESLASRIGSPMTVQLSQMTESLKSELIKNKEEFAKKDAQEIAMQQLSLQEQINRNVMSIAAVAKVRISDMLKEAGREPLQLVEIMSAGFGKSIEDFVKIDEKTGKVNFLTGAESLIADIKEKVGITGSLKSAEGIIREYSEKLNLTKKSEAENKKMIVENNINFNASSSMMDGFSRAIARDPRLQEEIFNSYRQNLKSYTYGGHGF